ncbi:MAG: DUF433 domain-containing protein [Verrucomicrobiota bacterium]
MADFPRITRNPTIMGGRACIRDTHIPVSAVMALLAAGRPEEEVMRMLPALTPEDLQEAMAYAAWWVDEPTQPQPLSKPVHVFPSVSAMLLKRTAQVAEPEKEAEEDTPTPIRSRPRGPFRMAPREDASAASPEDSPEALDVEGVVTSEEEIPDETLELYHPDYPDCPTVVVTRHGLFDRRWSTDILAWPDIQGIERRSGHKNIHIILRNPQYYLSAMPFFKRICTQIRLTLNLRTFYLDTASLGIRTKDLYFAANRLWHIHRGKVHYQKKRRVRIEKNSSRDSYWQKYLPK